VDASAMGGPGTRIRPGPPSKGRAYSVLTGESPMRGPSQEAARPPRAPPGRPESQLEPPGSWGHHWGASAAAEQLAVEPVLAASGPPSMHY
jgi:hypothetical protein